MGNRYKVTGQGTVVLIAPNHQCTQRVIPEKFIITSGAAANKNDTTITITASQNTKVVSAPIWLSFIDDDGGEVDILVTEDIDPGAVALTVAPLRLGIPSGATAEYPVKFPGMLSVNWEPVGEVDTTVPLDSGGFQSSSYTTLGGSFSVERHWFLDPAWLYCENAARKQELIWLSVTLPSPTCKDDDSYGTGPIREGFFLIDGGVPMDISGDAPIMSNVNFLLDGPFTKYSNTISLSEV